MMQRIDTPAKVYRGDVYPDDWVVWALGDDGEIVTSVFSGSDAEARAMEYATEKYASAVVDHAHQPPPALRVIHGAKP